MKVVPNDIFKFGGERVKRILEMYGKMLISSYFVQLKRSCKSYKYIRAPTFGTWSAVLEHNFYDTMTMRDADLLVYFQGMVIHGVRFGNRAFPRAHTPVIGKYK